MVGLIHWGRADPARKLRHARGSRALDVGCESRTRPMELIARSRFSSGRGASFWRVLDGAGSSFRSYRRPL